MSASLQLIPVLDLMAGQVVHALAGRRAAYRPLASPLCRSSSPEAVLEGLLALHPFRRCYIADLDAILGRGDHRATLQGLRRAYPELAFWVDAGFTGTDAARAWQAAGLGQAVLGSECLAAMPERAAFPDGSALSLDFRGDAFLGPEGLQDEPEHWPDDVIVMNLARVGVGAGPDLDRLARLRRLAPAARFYAAGGVRHAGDLVALAEAGAAGVLLATALHQGRLSPAELAAVHGARPTGAATAATETGHGRDR